MPFFPITLESLQVPFEKLNYEKSCLEKGTFWMGEFIIKIDLYGM